MDIFSLSFANLSALYVRHTYIGNEINYMLYMRSEYFDMDRIILLSRAFAIYVTYS